MLKGDLALDHMVNLVHATYHFLPNQHSRETASFLIFGWDSSISLLTLVYPKLRYTEAVSYVLSLCMFHMPYAAHSIKLADE